MPTGSSNGHVQSLAQQHISGKNGLTLRVPFRSVIVPSHVPSGPATADLVKAAVRPVSVRARVLCERGKSGMLTSKGSKQARPLACMFSSSGSSLAACPWPGFAQAKPGQVAIGRSPLPLLALLVSQTLTVCPALSRFCQASYGESISDTGGGEPCFDRTCAQTSLLLHSTSHVLPVMTGAMQAMSAGKSRPQLFMVKIGWIAAIAMFTSGWSGWVLL
eukprot:4897091-Amphidinium_carterae.1